MMGSVNLFLCHVWFGCIWCHFVKLSCFLFFIFIASQQVAQSKPNLLYMNKEVSESDKRMKMQLYASNDKGSLKTSEKLFPQDGYFGNQRSDLTLIKANFPENLWVYVNQASLSLLKNNKEAIYTANVALAQLLPLINSAPDIEKYECEENEVKLLCPVYNTESGRFLGLEKTVAVISIRGDSE